jgi:hypothetical protein
MGALIAQVALAPFCSQRITRLQINRRTFGEVSVVI